MKQNLKLPNAFLKNTEGSLEKLLKVMPNKNVFRRNITVKFQFSK